jgi:murein DD-endopeptidase MepM/ murein hydrolase activator NlpD
MSQLKDRLDHVQEQLDDSVARIEALRSREDELLFEVGRIELEIQDLEAAKEEIEARVVAAARRLYMTGGPDTTDTLEVLLSAESFADIETQYQVLTHIAERDRMAFTDLQKAEKKLVDLQKAVTARAEELTKTRSRRDDETALLQARFEEAAAAYEKLQEKLSTRVIFSPSGMACPVAGPNSFIDSWGFPRSGGRTHEGTDIMAASGTPVVAITDGRITFEGYGTSAGNWLILSGDDGDSYWYMHNRENLVSGGRVRAGEQIATVGDTGNAIGGPPHVHFEYHPGGGGPVNPYSLLSKVCRAKR